MNPDFRDLLSAFSACAVEYLVVGAHALAAHGHVRATKGLDVWVGPTRDNARRVLVTGIDGVEFGPAWLDRLAARLDGLVIPVLSRNDLIRN